MLTSMVPRSFCVGLALVATIAGCGNGSNERLGAGGSGGAAVAGTGGGGTSGQGGIAGTATVDGSAGAVAPDAGGSDAGRVDALTVETAMSTYTGWTKLMDQPVSISAQIASLCRSPTVPEMQFSSSEHGMGRFLLYWGNAEAAPGFLSKTTAQFPVGAAIVKEKFLPTSSGMTLVGKGAMIKRAAGFDPTHGDWEFAYWEPTSGTLDGPAEAQSCGSCHAAAVATDYVFLDQSWRTP